MFTLLLVWPFLEPRLTRDRGAHNLLARPHLTALGAAFLAWIVVVFAAGSADRITVLFGAAEARAAAE